MIARVLGVALLVVSTMSSVSASELDNLSTQFANDAPKQWKQYLAGASRGEGSVNFQKRDLNRNGAMISKTDSQVLVVGPLSKVQTSDGGTKRLSVINRKYAFELESIGDKWVISNVNIDISNVPGLGDDPLGGIGSALGAVPLRFTGRGLVLWATWLPKIVEDDSFEIREISYAGGEDKRLVQVEYEYNPSIVANNPIRGGTLTLDPENYWLVREATVRGEWPASNERGSIRITNNYEMDDAGFPWIKQQIMRVQASGNVHEAVNDEWVWNFDLREVEDEPEPSQFTLTAFGFSEPGMTGSTTSTMMFRITVLIALCLLLAIIARHWQSKPAAR